MLPGAKYATTDGDRSGKLPLVSTYYFVYIAYRFPTKQRANQKSQENASGHTRNQYPQSAGGRRRRRRIGSVRTRHCFFVEANSSSSSSSSLLGGAVVEPDAQRLLCLGGLILQMAKASWIVVGNGVGYCSRPSQLTSIVAAATGRR